MSEVTVLIQTSSQVQSMNFLKTRRRTFFVQQFPARIDNPCRDCTYASGHWMYISSLYFARAYDYIVDCSRGSLSSRTFILVAPDVDAICAAHLLHNMFSLDLVPNTVIPVASWSELSAVQERLKSEEVSRHNFGFREKNCVV